MRPTNLILLFLVLFFAKTIIAQEFSVTQFNLDFLSRSATENGRNNAKNQPCAILKITTPIEGVRYECPLGITGSQEFRNGAIWLYLSPGEGRIRFSKPGFVQKEFCFPKPIEQGAVYLMELKAEPAAVPVPPAGSNNYAFPANGSNPGPMPNETMPMQNGKELQPVATLVAKPAGNGDLYINSTPEGAEIYIDSILQGSKTPLLAERLTAGTHRLLLRKAGYNDVVKTVTVEANKISETVEVLPAPVEILITSVPEGAKLVVDGKIRGDTPRKVTLADGVHSVRVALQGYYVVNKDITVSDSVKTMTISMDPEVIFEMVLVEGGTFDMGSNEGAKEEIPVHSVTLSDFYIGKFEVTQKQWSDVMGEAPSKFPGCPQCPVESVSWNDIRDFLQKLNARSGTTYRLPTEAEWEYAARGGNRSQGFVYSGGNKTEDAGWSGLNSGSITHPVGAKLPNELGLFDMSGNVWEWCADLYDETYYTRSPKNNPLCDSSGRSYILRGGCWLSPASSLRVSARRWELPTQVNDMHGFRLALTK